MSPKNSPQLYPQLYPQRFRALFDTSEPFVRSNTRRRQKKLVLGGLRTYNGPADHSKDPRKVIGFGMELGTKDAIKSIQSPLTAPNLARTI